MEFHRQSFLTKLGFAALTCNSCLAIYRSRGDRLRRDRAALPLPAQLRARRTKGGQGQDQGCRLGPDDAAHGHVRWTRRAADADTRRFSGVAHGRRDRSRRVLGHVPQPVKLIFPCLVALPLAYSCRAVYSV